MNTLLKVALIGLFLTNIGCLGTEKQVVYVSLSGPPETGKGVLYVAQNDLIWVAIQGEDKAFKMNAGGMYLLPREDLDALVRLAREAETSK